MMLATLRVSLTFMLTLSVLIRYCGPIGAFCCFPVAGNCAPADEPLALCALPADVCACEFAICAGAFIMDVPLLLEADEPQPTRKRRNTTRHPDDRMYFLLCFRIGSIVLLLRKMYACRTGVQISPYNEIAIREGNSRSARVALPPNNKT